jgi:hypothetical protein
MIFKIINKLIINNHNFKFNDNFKNYIIIERVSKKNTRITFKIILIPIFFSYIYLKLI